MKRCLKIRHANCNQQSTVSNTRLKKIWKCKQIKSKWWTHKDIGKSLRLFTTEKFRALSYPKISNPYWTDIDLLRIFYPWNREDLVLWSTNLAPVTYQCHQFWQEPNLTNNLKLLQVDRLNKAKFLPNFSPMLNRNTLNWCTEMVRRSHLIQG